MLELEELYHLYKTDLYRYCLYLCRDAHQAEDLLSETFLRAFKGLAGFRSESKFKTWLYGIARNTWLEDLRRQKPQLEYDDLLGLYLEDRLAEQSANRGLLQSVHELLAQKGPPSSKVLELRAQGYSYAFIAQHLRISESSARVIEHRTRSWLKEILKKEDFWND